MKGTKKISFVTVLFKRNKHTNAAPFTGSFRKIEKSNLHYEGKRHIIYDNFFVYFPMDNRQQNIQSECLCRRVLLVCYHMQRDSFTHLQDSHTTRRCTYRLDTCRTDIMHIFGLRSEMNDRMKRGTNNLAFSLYLPLSIWVVLMARKWLLWLECSCQPILLLLLALWCGGGAGGSGDGWWWWWKWKICV